MCDRFHAPKRQIFSRNWAGPRLEFGVPAVAFQPIGPTTVQPLVRCEPQGRTKSKLKAVEIQFSDKFDQDAHVGGKNTRALDWPPVFLRKPTRRSCEARDHPVTHGSRDFVRRNDRQWSWGLRRECAPCAAAITTSQGPLAR